MRKNTKKNHEKKATPETLQEAVEMFETMRGGGVPYRKAMAEVEIATGVSTSVLKEAIHNAKRYLAGSPKARTENPE